MRDENNMLISACLMGFRVRYHGLDEPVVLDTRWQQAQRRKAQ